MLMQEMHPATLTRQAMWVLPSSQASEGAAALETVLCVDLVTIDRSLSLLTRVLIC